MRAIFSLARAARLRAMVLVAAAAWLSAAPVARAACGVTAEAVARAEVAFVGLLTDVSADGAQAIFEVEDVWRGRNLSARTSSPQVDASAGMFQMPPAGTPASRYLVLAHTVDGRLRTGDECMLFPFPWDASYAAFRPDVPLPSSEPAETGLPGPMVAIIAAAALIGAVGVVAFRRRSPGG